MPVEQRKKLVDKDIELSIVQQCILLNLCRSSLYYEPKGEDELNLRLMRLIDEHYLKYPFKGAGRMHTYLTKDLGYKVSKNRIERLYYKVMGLRSILPGPHTSKRHKDHKVYPYLLRDLDITKSNQVWAMDITYIPMQRGYMYLTAIIDLHSRMVLTWSLSNTMDAQWCAQVYTQAVQDYGAPKIINTDQGSQFTSTVFTEAVMASGAKLSMDGKGRATDNAFIERLWRSLKYEHVYIYAYHTVQQLQQGLEDYISYYNGNRRHTAIDDRYPQEVYLSALSEQQKKPAA